MRRVLVTGASGFSGAHMVTSLRGYGFDVVGHTRQDMGDLLDLYTLPDGCEAIVHCAASSALDGKTPDDLFRDNAQVTRHLAELAVHKGVSRFIYFSTMSIYGEVQDRVVDENTTRHTPNAYAQSKYEGEMALRELSASLPSIALRTPGILGVGAHRNWVVTVTQKLIRGDEVCIFNPDQPFNNCSYILNVADFVKDLLDLPLEGYQPLVLGAGDTISIGEVVALLKQELKSPSQIRVEETDKTSFHIDCTRAIKEFGYRPLGMAQMLVQYSTDVKR